MKPDEDSSAKILGESHVPKAPLERSHTGVGNPQAMTGPFEPGRPISFTVPVEQPAPAQPPANSTPPSTQTDE